MKKFPFQLCVILVSVHHIYGSISLSRRWRRQACGTNQFQCNSGECIDRFLLCDGEINCKDRSDETESVCKTISCPSFAHQCDYGGCVDANAKCNGVAECADNSDENGCPTESSTSCKQNQYTCKSGICIDPFLICDGTEDCDDGSDETSEACSGFTCPSFAFRCDYGGCIDKDGKCNGVIQCADKSDEKPEICGTSSTTTTTTTKAPPVTEGCILPPQPENGKYELPGCDPPCIPEPGTRVYRTFINYTCSAGFMLSGSQLIACHNGWKLAFPTCSRVSCPPLVNPTRDIECILDSNKVECEKPMAPGTIAKFKCKTFFSHSPEFSNYETHCGSNGKWSREMTACTLKCGERNPEGVPFISNGIEAKKGEFPWHVGIYRPVEGDLQQICGGTIVSERVIVSAAHCFWDEEKEMPRDVKDHRVVVGKFYLDWNKNNSYVQYPEIEKLIIRDRYIGHQGLYVHDIAIIILRNPITITVAVRPICFDYEKKSQQFFTPGKKGIVVGWGLSEKQTQTESLHTATLPYVDYDTCEKEVPISFKGFLTYDKFCAGYKNGTSVCPGDSGGGYATQFRDGKWYLMGIVSVGVPSQNADRCNIMEYTTFTSIITHYDFVKQYIT